MSFINGVFSTMRISASGMRAQRIQQSTITSNLANIETTRTPEGGPFRREFAVFEADGRDTMTAIRQERALAISGTNLNHISLPSTRFTMHETEGGVGVRVAEIRQDSREPRLVFNPSHPDANEHGYVAMPNINVVEEMSNMIAASRAYEANATAFNATKQMMMAVFQG